MKTISDIKENVELLHTMDRHARMETEVKIFKYYDECAEIQKVISDLENHIGVNYEFDECGGFNAYLEVSKEIEDLPKIGSYLSQQWGNYKDGIFSQSLSSPITINWTVTNLSSYFIYDHDTGKPVMENIPAIEGHPTITEETYISAILAEYQNNKGEFSDIVETDYHGSYVKHYDLMKHLQDSVENLDDREGLQKIIEEYEREGLQKIIDEYEREKDDE